MLGLARVFVGPPQAPPFRGEFRENPVGEAMVTCFEFTRWNLPVQATVPQKCIRAHFCRKIKFVMPHKKIHMHLEKVAEPNPRFRWPERKILLLFGARHASVGDSSYFPLLCGTRGACGCIASPRRSGK